MGNNAAKKKTASAESEIEQMMHELDSKQYFIATALNMSWRLAVTVLVPTIGGIFLDRRFDTSPSYTLAGFTIALFFGAMTVWATVKEVNEMQAEAEEKLKRSKK